MCHGSDVGSDCSAEVGSGDRTRVRSGAVTIDFLRHNYITYPDLGDNLRQDIWAFIGRAASPTLNDFTFVLSEQESELLRLFNETRIGQVPDSFEDYLDQVRNRFVYLYSLETHEIVEIHYRSATDWDADFYEQEGDTWEVQSTIGSGEDLLTFDLSAVRSTVAIALPDSVAPDTIAQIFNDSALRDLCRVNLASAVETGHRRFLVFDPAHLVTRAADVINHHRDWMRIIDAREPIGELPRMTPHRRRRRKEGIMTCMAKQLLLQNSGALDSGRTRRLNRDFTHFSNYAYRRALFIDNMFNFLSHDIMVGMQRNLLQFQEGNTRPDGGVWLKIIAPLAEIAGDHDLLIAYFSEESDRSETESCFASFFRVALAGGTARERSSVRAWNRAMQAGNFTKLAKGVAEAKAYLLLTEYMSQGRGASLDAFRTSLEDAQTSLERFCGRVPARVRSSGTIASRLSAINSVFGWASRLGALKNALDNPTSAANFSVILDNIAEFAKLGGTRFVGIATRATALKQVVDLGRGAGQFGQRLGVHDYDAAFGQGLVIGAGLIEVGYIGYMLATTLTLTTLSGPIGVAVAIVGAIGAIIVVLCQDSDMETYLRHSKWGANFGSGSAVAWSDGRLDQFDERATGLDRQLNSIMNLVHQYDVRHTYSSHNAVIGITIEAKFLPDTVRFEFKGEFNGSRGRGRVQFSLKFPVRQRGEARMTDFRQNGIDPINRCNIQVSRSGNEHHITVNLVLDRNVGINQARGWLTCYPFDHTEFVVPNAADYQKTAFDLDNLLGSDNHSFQESEWCQWPLWRV